MPISASDASRELLSLIEKVNNDRVAVEITSHRGNAVLIPADEYAALQETAHLLRTPANANRLIESLCQVRSGERHEDEPAELLIEEAQEDAERLASDPDDRAELLAIQRLMGATD